MLKGVLLVAVLVFSISAGASEIPGAPVYVFTSAPRYDPAAWTEGRDRFPSGASLVLVAGRARRALAPDLAASADAAVSFDGMRILFAAKRTPSNHWAIFETTVTPGPVRQITSGDFDCIRPLYLPDGGVAYTRVSAGASDVEVVPLDGGQPARLTFAPGRYLTSDVLRDGRILFETAGEIFTVYPDGTGVESLRCDHGPIRSAARQLSSGDVIFSVAGRLARFTSARAEQLDDVPQPDLQAAGPVAEFSAGTWIVPLKRKPAGTVGLFLWTLSSRQVLELEAPAGSNAVEPAVIAARPAPRQFPSALVPTRATGNLLCLNVHTAKTPLPTDVSTVRVYSQDSASQAVLLGQAPVERDGSFYVEVPADRPLRIELLDASGSTARAEHGWFWMRPSEQRVCVGCHAGPQRAPENKVPEILLRTTKPEKLLGLKP